MPDLFAVGDAEALDNRYVAKVIVYVEADEDREAYSRIAGPDVRDRLEFKTTGLGSGGWEAVRDRVKVERPTNDKVYGLVDGEAVVHFDGWEALVACDRHLFQVQPAAAEGMIFISSHELENLLLLYGDICGVIVKGVKLKELTKHDAAVVQAGLHKAARRFFIAAAMTYAANELRRTGVDSVVFNNGKFVDGKSATRLLAELAAEVKAEGLSWPTLRTEIRKVLARLKARFKDEGLNPAAKAYHFIRLADGKRLLAGMRKTYQAKGPWDGHLVDQVCRAPYADAFRSELLTLTHA